MRTATKVPFSIQALKEHEPGHPLAYWEPIGEAISSPYVSMLDHLMQNVTLSRVVAALLCAAFTVCGILLVDENKWEVSVTLPNVQNEAGCLSLCEKTWSDEDFATNLGGKGICSTVSFKHCGFSASEIRKFKTKSCSSNTTSPATTTAKCKFTVVPAIWKPYVAISVFVLVVLCCFQNCPSDILLISGASILCLVKIISYEELFKGFSSGSVIGLALLGPISFAIEVHPNHSSQSEFTESCSRINISLLLNQCSCRHNSMVIC